MPEIKTLLSRREFSIEDLVTVCVTLLGVYLLVLLMYYAETLSWTRTRYVNLFVGPGLALFYLLKYRQKRYADEETETTGNTGILRTSYGKVVSRISSPVGKRYISVLYPLLGLVAIACTVYVELNFDRLLHEAPVLGRTSTDYLVGLILIVLVTHATKVAYGWAITLVTIASLLYAMLGPLMPGILSHSGMSLGQIAVSGAIGLQGAYGFIMGIGSTWVAVFIMFAGIAKQFGFLDYVLDLGQELSNFFKSGVVQVALISSLIIGSITGSAAANTATTGSFTIPMMQQQGVKDEYAAAIEAVASSGAQIMPPVMGVAAFLMADILGIPFVSVLKAGLLPAILFYAAVAVSIHFVTLRYGWIGERSRQFDTTVLPSGIHFAVPIVVLLYTLVVMRLTPLTAGFYTILSLVGIHSLRTIVVEEFSLDTIIALAGDLVRGARQGGIEMAPLIGVLAALGVIVEMVTQTGLSQKLSVQIIGLAGGVFIALLVLAMITSILFGLGMPTPAAYILVVILVAPALIEIGVRELTAHLFVFYFAMLSAITPPVAISVVVGSQIAGTTFMRAAYQSLRIGACAFLLPYAFIYNDALIYWEIPLTIYQFVFVLIAFVLIGVSLIGFDGVEDMPLPERVLFLAIAGVILFGPTFVQAGACLVGLVVVSRRRIRPIFNRYIKPTK
jgi:TRAP transporter 4TM/12TM fusion protein